ncbi:hypothetical protein Amsp01_048470 [Amycolatopsis sp. NBRC 101858]|uniref:hypothetical protein n=1 Tax=Amycolatopsis sp. NBRC 101858 TaxID=3032200 RepID=UPI0024A199B5|nr:hypothetical protein [Amycolatopsis sp. NBRC 101858]GLY38823.1 hypothetical protein Amsp01_048470 [Amycolatopsis sp. NBRC 101858]
MAEADARELLVRVCRRPVAWERAAAEVVELCGRLPLAIRLAGTRLRHHDTWSVADLLRYHQRRPWELAAGSAAPQNYITSTRSRSADRRGAVGAGSVMECSGGGRTFLG